MGVIPGGEVPIPAGRMNSLQRKRDVGLRRPLVPGVGDVPRRPISRACVAGSTRLNPLRGAQPAGEGMRRVWI
jgi:hypothetical protein